MKKFPKRLLLLLSEIACATLLTLFFSYMWQGIPLFGLPKAEHITTVEITDAALEETRTFTDTENIVLARSSIGCLKYRLKDAEAGEAQITIRYTDEKGRAYEVAANEKTVFYQGKAHPLKEERVFVQIIEGIFFFDSVAAQ